MLLLLLSMSLPVAPSAAPPLLAPPWVEIGAGGQIVARAIVNEPSACPSVLIDGRTHPMTLRAPVPDGFRPACEFPIPSNARAASIAGRPLRLPRPNPRRIVTFGDTGCRINAVRVQNCNDLDEWPLPRVAERAAAARPDLVIHVGDYLYREVACPPDRQAFCGNTPIGDGWEAWNADFFTPAAKLLSAAPWVVARGNHEDCNRSWRGWFYYLDPRPWAGMVCEPFSAPYVVRLGAFEVVVLDSSGVTATGDEQQTRIFAEQLSSLKTTHAWLVDHHPFWVLSADADGQPQPVTIPLQEAWTRASPRGIDLIVSGHVHLFEALTFEDKRPPQIVAGMGGTLLGTLVTDRLDGVAVGGTRIATIDTHRTFGYTLFTRVGARWRIALRTPQDGTVVACTITGRQSKCEPPQHPAKRLVS